MGSRFGSPAGGLKIRKINVFHLLRSPASSSRQANEKARRDFFADKEPRKDDEVSKNEKRDSYAEEAKEDEEMEGNKEEKTTTPPLNSQDKRSCTIF